MNCSSHFRSLSSLVGCLSALEMTSPPPENSSNFGTMSTLVPTALPPVEERSASRLADLGSLGKVPATEQGSVSVEGFTIDAVLVSDSKDADFTVVSSGSGSTERGASLLFSVFATCSQSKGEAHHGIADAVAGLMVTSAFQVSKLFDSALGAGLEDVADATRQSVSGADSKLLTAIPGCPSALWSTVVQSKSHLKKHSLSIMVSEDGSSVVKIPYDIFTDATPL